MIRHYVLLGTLLGGALATLVAAGCGRIAVWAAPEKTASAERTPAAVEADKVFWATLHGGAYDRIPEALTALKAAYLAKRACGDRGGRHKPALRAGYNSGNQ